MTGTTNPPSQLEQLATWLLNTAGGVLSGFRRIPREFSAACGIVLRALATGKLASLIAGSAVVSAGINALIFLHYKALQFEILPLVTDPAVSIQALQHVFLTAVSAVVAAILVAFLAGVFKSQDTNATASDDDRVRSWSELRATLAAPKSIVAQKSVAIVNFIIPTVFALIFGTAAILVAAFTASRMWPLWNGPNSTYCVPAARHWLIEAVTPQCKSLIVTVGNAVEGDRSVAKIQNVYEVGRFGSIALYINPTTGARIVMSTSSVVMNASEGVSFDPVFGPDDYPGSLRNRLDEMAFALGLSGETLQCLRQADRGRLSWVEFRFEENSAEFCVESSEHTTSAMCTRPEAEEYRKANFAAMSRLTTIVSQNTGFFDTLMIYGFANSSGSSQGNLKISNDRANAIAAVLEKQFASDAIPRLIASGRGEFWRYDKIPALFGLTERTDKGRPEGSPSLAPSEGTSAIVAACSLQ